MGVITYFFRYMLLFDIEVRDFLSNFVVYLVILYRGYNIRWYCTAIIEYADVYRLTLVSRIRP